MAESAKCLIAEMYVFRKMFDARNVRFPQNVDARCICQKRAASDV